MLKKTRIKKTLYDIYGVDWQQSEKIKVSCKKNPYGIKLTPTKIWKLFDLKKSNLNLVLIRYKTASRYQRCELLEIDKEDKVFIDTVDASAIKNQYYYKNPSFSLYGKFFSKTDAMNEIKSAEYIHVIEVTPEALRVVKQEKSLDSQLFYNDDLNFRIKPLLPKGSDWAEFNHNIKVNINGKLKRLDIGFAHGAIGSVKNYYLADFVDKSGYSLINHRNKLKAKLEKLHQENLIQAIDKKEHIAPIKSAYRLIENMMTILSVKLTASSTNIYYTRLKDFVEIQDCLDCCIKALTRLKNLEEIIEEIKNSRKGGYGGYHSYQDILDTVESIKQYVEQQYRKDFKDDRLASKI